MKPNQAAKPTEQKKTAQSPFKKTDSKAKGLKVNKNLPPLAFMIFDLTSKSQDARIIKITQLTVFKNGETELSHHLFNNEETPISEEAYAHHRISAEDLKDKPKLSTFDFFAAKNIVVWDGKVTRNILRKNGITKLPSIINMQALARYLDGISGAISLNSYALKANPKKKNLIEFMLKKPENKIHVMPEIYEHLKTQYLEKHTENCASFMVTVGKAQNAKAAMEAIKVFLEKRTAIEKSNKLKGGFNKTGTNNRASDAPQNDKNVIVVKTSQTQINQGVKAVVIKKRVK